MSGPLRAFVGSYCLDVWGASPERWEALVSDGSDRQFFRFGLGNRTVVAICHPGGRANGENDAHVAIGRHMRARGIPVPNIFKYHRENGWIIMEDLGDLSLQKAAQSAGGRGEVLALYGPVLDALMALQVRGSLGFDGRWCYQGMRYDERLMLERESGYFLGEFLRGYLGWCGEAESLLKEFEVLARRASEAPAHFLMHRDFQSRNVLLPHPARPHLIDFQGARWGPLQYDVAALLVDPYVSLAPEIRRDILGAYLERLEASKLMAPERFLRHYPIVALHRNLQILGAFAFLGRTKNKPFFLQWIPGALANLGSLLESNPDIACPALRDETEAAQEALSQRKVRTEEGAGGLGARCHGGQGGQPGAPLSPGSPVRWR